MEAWDTVVVGAGILGLATARELLLRNPDARVLVLEREDEIAAHQTGHNSGVIHAGIYYAPGSLKAKLCTEGRAALYEFCDQYGIKYERCGKLIVALHDSELPGLAELERRGIENGVPGLRRLSGGEIAEIEPHAIGVAALHSPETGIIDFGAVARFMAKEITELGATIQTGVSVSSLARNGSSSVVETSVGSIPATRVVACAGLWSDRLAEASGESGDPRIIPFRGGYLKLKPHARHLVRSMIYPVPDPNLPFLGVHLTKTIDGDITLGPSALLAPSRTAYSLASFDREDLAVDADLARHLQDGPQVLAHRASPRWASPPVAPPSSERAPPTSRPCRSRTSSPAPRAFAPRPSPATASSSTTSPSRPAQASCTSATPRRPPQPPHWRSQR